MKTLQLLSSVPIQILSSALVFLLVLTGCSATEDQTSSDYPNSHLLLSASELNQQLESREIFLIDARAETTDTFIPESVHFPSIQGLADPDHPVANFLVSPDDFQGLMRDLGINRDDRVVIYDEGNGLAATRLFYALDYYGFSNAAVLNGGIQAWLAEDLSVTDSPVTREPGDFLVDVQEAKMCDFDYILEAVESPDKIIFDTRSPEEYSGADQRAERSGHIPNAVHLEWNNVIEQEGIPYFLPAREIQNVYASLGITPDKEVIPHCQSNVRGSHAYFTLRLMGYDSVRPYEGSWAEYGNREDAPIQQ